MNKKYIIIIAVILLIAAVWYFSRNSQSVKDAIAGAASSNAKSDATKAQANITPSGEADENEYNIAREQYRKLSGNYPPDNWTLDQINLWIDEWTQMSQYLEKYAANMASMQQTEKAKSNVAACQTVADAKLLYESSVNELAVYKEKMSLYAQLVDICNEYHIDATDLGISSVATSTKAQISNALTRARSFADLKTRYDKLASMCQIAGVNVLQYLSGKKWFNLTIAELDAAISTVNTLYEQSIYDKAHTKAYQIAENINPLITGDYTGLALASFRDRPYENRWALDPQIFRDVVEFCAQSPDHLRVFKSAFRNIGLKYPSYRCQAQKLWNKAESLSKLIFDGLAHSGGATHLTARDNWKEIKKLVDAKLAPLV